MVYEVFVIKKEGVQLYKKIQSLYALMTSCINVHEYKIPKNYDEFKNTIQDYNNFCTVRCDHTILTKDLPFYVINIKDESYLKEIWTIAQKNKYKLIIANGLKHDKSQYYNLVVKFNTQGNFMAEISKKKVPLRHMYKYPNELLSVSGNIDKSIREWTVYNQVYGLDRRIILHDLKELFNLGIVDKWLECTFYPYPVGIFKKNYVVWQIAD